MGKDSIAVMDLCFKYFKHVQPFFMYMVPGLQFQEEALAKHGVDWKTGKRLSGANKSRLWPTFSHKAKTGSSGGVSKLCLG